VDSQEYIICSHILDAVLHVCTCVHGSTGAHVFAFIYINALLHTSIVYYDAMHLQKLKTLNKHELLPSVLQPNLAVLITIRGCWAMILVCHGGQMCVYDMCQLLNNFNYFGFVMLLILIC
jgi:hypothetical protein